MQLFCTITASNGQRVPLTIDDNETTKMTPTQLRTQVSTVTKIPITELRLIFRGRMIKDDDTLEHSVLTEYKLENESVLHCMGKPVVVAVAAAVVDSSDNNTVSGTTTSTSSSSAGATVDSNRTVVPPLSRPMGSRSSAASIPRSLPIMNPNGDVSSNVNNLDNDPLKKALVRLRQNNPPSIYATGVTTLERVLKNIIDHPMEEKYRQVKKQNAAFNKRLGGLIGGHDCMLATGFTVDNDTSSSEEVYKLQATAQKWTYLTEKAQQIVIDASQQAKLQQQQAQQPSSSSLPVGVGVGGVPAGGGNGGAGGMMPGLPGGGPGGMNMNMNMNDPNMQNMMSQMMQNPEALATALQNPMIQQMMQNDPNISPMMRQQMEAMSNNPAMLQQMTQRMQDPTVQAQLRQAMAANGGGGGANGGGGPMGGGMGGMMPNSNNDAGAAAPPAQQQQQQLQPPRNDTNQTEDDMIAEAIRRSLEDAS
ncbi:hypothetical protein FRACYDRAFT_243999 [Fragilariopsis cylindrus CCMP1102]|uniref:Ubiquitin-like domain-containing protein n=1 Tax=Fragilariopsis cylindrus CCMP1102 TaxID=635003 RepID=A0A1E7F4F6_9STRA|nr:hypothetical protein FRACYDRAFT_243999 [Fragilariopsis cylindrus CCMP1102]|eukprot:OEU12743.1 hypothetical protein FRACYDRAFT_243999 [Fragilariopsis cylindrus CCMP1102]